MSFLMFKIYFFFQPYFMKFLIVLVSFSSWRSLRLKGSEHNVNTCVCVCGRHGCLVGMYISMNEQVQQRKFESFLQCIRLSVNDIQYLHWGKAKYEEWNKKNREGETRKFLLCHELPFLCFFHILSILLAYAAMIVLLWKIKHVKNKRQFSHYKHWARARKNFVLAFSFYTWLFSTSLPSFCLVCLQP